MGGGRKLANVCYHLPSHFGGTYTWISTRSDSVMLSKCQEFLEIQNCLGWWKMKNMLVKLGSSSPNFGVKIPNIFELPPPRKHVRVAASSQGKIALAERGKDACDQQNTHFSSKWGTALLSMSHPGCLILLMVQKSQGQPPGTVLKPCK